MLHYWNKPRGIGFIMAYIEGYLDCDDCETRNGIEFGKMDSGRDYYECTNCDFLQVG
jgi:hypothetical protein